MVLRYVKIGSLVQDSLEDIKQLMGMVGVGETKVLEIGGAPYQVPQVKNSL
jgi:hypothetical protein